MAEEPSEVGLAQCTAPFVTTVLGVPVHVQPGHVYRKTDPVVAASPRSFEDVKVRVSSDYSRPLRLQPTGWEVETATAAPGERRTLTTPPAAVRPGAGKQDTGRTAPKATAGKAAPKATPAPSEV